MRPILIGLIAAFMAAAMLPATAMAATPAPPKATVDPASRTKGMTGAPGVITATGLDCELADARLLGPSTDPKTKEITNYYEIACKGSEGFIVGEPAKPGPLPIIYSCLEVAASGAANVQCILPGNADPKQGLLPLIAKNRPDCTLSNARAIGQTADRSATVFEVACQGGAGYIVDASFPVSAAKPATFNPCLAFGPTTVTKCTLTDQATQDTYFATLVTQIGKPCTLTNHRWVGATSGGANYFEVSCQDGKGYMFSLGADGKPAPAIDCAVADNIGGGCTMTNARAAQTAQADLYTRLANAAGFSCTVAKYFPFDTAPPGYEAVELACSNRADGAVGLFPASSTDHSKIYDCAHSELVGFRCTFTQPVAALPTLTDDLKKLGKTSCAVSGERVVGVTADKVGYIEVACSDGAPGFVISYDVNTMTPKDATTCSMAKGIAGGCQMPANLPKH